VIGGRAPAGPVTLGRQSRISRYSGAKPIPASSLPGQKPNQTFHIQIKIQCCYDSRTGCRFPYRGSEEKQG